MKQQLYSLLVNRVPGIRDRFLQKRRQGAGRVFALVYLIWLNVQYHLLRRRSLGRPARFPYYEEKALYTGGSESSLSARQGPEEFAAALMGYDVISFDVFDTLLLRPFSRPEDLFLLLGQRLQYPGFQTIRMKAEAQARQIKKEQSGAGEVTLEEIWRLVEQQTGIPKESGMQAEWECERDCCFANPYFHRVWAAVRKSGKRMIVISDMYLGQGRLNALLKNCGYGLPDACYVSCDFGVSKYDGGLFAAVRQQEGETLCFAHIGDNKYADGQQAARHGFQPFLYANVNQTGNRYRPFDLSAVTGSLYRGIVNAHIHNGLSLYSREYEYGFVYGGLFVVGYCRFIHRYAAAHHIDKILFLARDGAVLLQAYRLLYPGEAEKTVYAYWSRQAAVKLAAGYFRREYLQRFVHHKAGHRFTIAQVLQGMELDHLLRPLCQEEKIRPDEPLTHKNAGKIEDYLIVHWDQVLAAYAGQRQAARLYFAGLLGGCRHAAAVDIGWAGSGAVMLNTLVNREWELCCPITGILAGSASCAGPEGDDWEPFLFSGQLVSYLYSQQKNRDLWKYHDPASNHNLYWELLLGCSQGSLKGFYPNGKGGFTVRFKDPAPSAGHIDEIHRGILDFVRLFLQTERRLGVAVPVSGRDAYAPMLAVENPVNKKFQKYLEGMLDDAHIG